LPNCAIVVFFRRKKPKGYREDGEEEVKGREYRTFINCKSDITARSVKDEPARE